MIQAAAVAPIAAALGFVLMQLPVQLFPESEWLYLRTPTWQQSGEMRVFIASLLSMSGCGGVLAFTLFLHWISKHRWPANRAIREQTTLSGVAAAGVLWLWTAAVADDTRNDILLALLLVVHSPTVIVCYALLGWAVQRLRNPFHAVLLPGGFAGVSLHVQLLYEPAGPSRPELLVILPSLLIALALALALITWSATQGVSSRGLVFAAPGAHPFPAGSSTSTESTPNSSLNPATAASHPVTANRVWQSHFHASAAGNRGREALTSP